MNSLGAIYTPPDVTSLITEWAVQSSDATILDLGVGEGAFVYSCYNRLIQLGTPSKQAESQIYGTEIDQSAFDTFKAKASYNGLEFPNLVCKDFFQVEFPLVDVVIGNPPYIRRRRVSSDQIDEIRASVLTSNLGLNKLSLSHLTDLYVYFLLKAIPFLKPGGKLAVIVADSWLNARYGSILKQNLKTHFEIEQIMTFDRQLFKSVQVKPTILLATKKSAQISHINNTKIAFTRIMNGVALDTLKTSTYETGQSLKDVKTLYVSPVELDAKKPWGIHFKISEVMHLLNKLDLFVPIHQIAYTRIGLQTLAENFFVFTNDEAKEKGIEPRFLKPYAHSINYFNATLLDEPSQSNLLLFFCANSKDDLAGTKALEHILAGETQEVVVHGKDYRVIGYHNKQRIKRASRPHWYDIKTEIEKRGYAPILIPRLIYRDFRVLWNRAQFVPGGAVIEFTPICSEIDIRVFLAILNSSLMEILLRGFAQLYGGGTYNVAPAQLKTLPFLDINRLSENDKAEFINAFEYFVKTNDRGLINSLMCNILGIESNVLESTVEDLRLMATTAKKR